MNLLGKLPSTNFGRPLPFGSIECDFQWLSDSDRSPAKMFRVKSWQAVFQVGQFLKLLRLFYLLKPPTRIWRTWTQILHLVHNWNLAQRISVSVIRNNIHQWNPKSWAPSLHDWPEFVRCGRKAHKAEFDVCCNHLSQHGHLSLKKHVAVNMSINSKPPTPSIQLLDKECYYPLFYQPVDPCEGLNSDLHGVWTVKQIP